MITLKQLTWSNCFSYGDNNTVNLEKDILVQLIGENGAGKSSIPIILEEVLYNKNSKGIKKADIVNRNRSDKGYELGITFSVDNKSYSIEVARKSSLKVILKCEEEDISSHTATNTFKTIESILGVDFKTFSQLVYQSTTSSLQFLTATDTNRKKFLIELLNLDKYLQLFDNFKKAHKESSENVSAIKGSINTITSWIESNTPTNTTKMIETDIPEVDESIIEEQGLIKSKLANINTINSNINANNQYRELLAEIDMQDILNPVEKPEETNYLYEDIGKFQGIVTAATTTIEKLNGLELECPTCLQSIDSKFKKDLLEKTRKELLEAESELSIIQAEITRLKKAKKRWMEYNKLVTEFERLNSLIDKSLPTETEDQSELKRRQQEIVNILKEQNDARARAIAYNAKVVKFNTELDYLLQQVQEFKTSLSNKRKDLKKAQDIFANLEVLKKAFSTNGLIAYKIENLVKDLEDLVNEYLAELSDGRFGLAFEVTNDKLNVIISDNGLDIDILALSSGELARVNTATLLAIRKLMSTLSKSKINILFLDEVINVLDNDGRERLIEVLLKENELNTFLVSHGWTHPLLAKINVIKQLEISRLE